MLSEVSSFFGDVGSSRSKEEYLDRWRKRVFFVLSSEFHYTQKDIEETEIPFILELLNEREKDIKEQKKAMKQR